MKLSRDEVLKLLPSDRYTWTPEQVAALEAALVEIERLEQEHQRDWAAIARATDGPPTDWSDFGIPYFRQ